MNYQEICKKYGYANLSCADLSYADLSYADLSCANLSDANLSDADLSYADLSYANLRDADLSCADLSGANLIGANLRDANLSCADLSDADLSVIDQFALIEQIANTVFQSPNALKMKEVHACATTHCLAGWVCELNETAKQLESKFGWNAAACFTIRVPEFTRLFYSDDQTALNWLKNELPLVKAKYLPTND